MTRLTSSNDSIVIFRVTMTSLTVNPSRWYATALMTQALLYSPKSYTHS